MRGGESVPNTLAETGFVLDSFAVLALLQLDGPISIRWIGYPKEAGR